ncbi:uncharacterized protein LOC135204688 [Macrobrachium nipponense]|uniref:uncharacterized protein LOC135204688 n=1 Tax=Macrobrachium nipponense TaxID=159736 RepID=UPI0030C89CC1
MVTEIFALTFLLTVGNLAHCQEWENLLFVKMGEMLEKQEAALMKQEAALSQLKGMQGKQEQVEGKLQEIQEKQHHVEGKLQEMQEKLQWVKINLQDFHHELEHVKGAVNSNQDSLQNISAKLEILEDVDECAQGKDECSPLATCRNSVGSYSCSCNPPFEGDGRTCEFSCESPAKVLGSLGCVKPVTEWKTFEEIKATCHQAGGRLLQNFSIGSLQEVIRALTYHVWMGWTGWLGVHEGRWLESGLSLQEGLWTEGSRGSDPSLEEGALWHHLLGFFFFFVQTLMMQLCVTKRVGNKCTIT